LFHLSTPQHIREETVLISRGASPNIEYIKGQGKYNEELMKQVPEKGNKASTVKGTSAKDICNICDEDFDDDDDDERTWIQCEACYQWVHCDCAGVSDSVIEDEFDVPYECDNCEKQQKK